MRIGPYCLAVLLAWLGGLAACPGQVIVSNTYENLDADRALEGVPVTFSRVAARGDFTGGVTPRIDGRKLPAQVDVLRKAPDGSIRHALVSFVLPRLPAGGKVSIDWLDERPPAPPAFRWGFDRSAFELRLVLTTAEGKELTSDVGRALAGGWTARPRVKVLVDGPVMKEFEIHDVPADVARRRSILTWKRACRGELPVAAVPS